jgi:restriction system protein
MTAVERVIWGVHMSREHGTAPVENGYVAIGWSEMGDLSQIKPQTRDAFKAAYIQSYPNAKTGTIPVSAGVAYRFRCEMKAGDIVVYPSKHDRMVNIGILVDDYNYVASDAVNCPQHRNVKWNKHVPRASFSQAALNEIGSALTLFRVTSNVEEFLAALEGRDFEQVEADETSAESVTAQVEMSTEDFIIKRLKHSQTYNEFEHFFAHLLKCMGYHARVTQASGDGGVDIIAHRDELGFEPPLIKVQCKQTLSPIGRPDVQKLFGAIEREEKGLFVTLGTFTSDARTFERTKHNLRLIDGSELIELIFTHYDSFESRYQRLIPLKRTFVPGTIIS